MQLMKAASFPQAFLFTGPKGTGKTSTSRILGAMLNDDQNQAAIRSLFFEHKKPAAPLLEPNPQTERSQHIFAGESYLVQELDAASNRRIDDIRALKDQIQLAPIDGLIKVYILDEVHMLTTEAFNALLKMLEEPPPHVVFILATTELDKVPTTVRSRCQIVHFTKATHDELLSALNPIIKDQKLRLKPALVEEVITQADGSFRDAVKYLEMISHLDKADLNAVKQLLGSNLDQYIEQLIIIILEKQASEVVNLFVNLREQGVAPDLFYKNLIAYLHGSLIKSLLKKEQLSILDPRVTQTVLRFLLDEFSQPGIELPAAIPFLRLELKALQIIDRATHKKPPSSNSSNSSSQTATSNLITKNKKLTSNQSASNHTQSQVTSKMSKSQNNNQPIKHADHHHSTSLSKIDVLTGNGAKLCQEWSSFVDKVAKDNFSLATLLKSAHPVAGDKGEVTLSVYYRFHQEQLAQPRFQSTLNELITNAYGGPLKINCVLNEQPADAELTEPTLPDKLEKLAVEALM